MHLQRRWLVPRRLADHHGLDQIAHDRHQPLLGLFVCVVAGEEDQLANDDLDILRIELRLHPRHLLGKILGRRFGIGEFRDQLFARRFQLVQLVVQDGETRPAFGMPFVDLGHKALLR
ncbi:hypothetical protein [Rhizobium bangladeshense]|uniref:hypothetical protein n=1 Tax=Rhizobium bangladeshense TaxID=1138189 RepID=UPI002180AA68|nr:hypothetical protein [Rhizobium bangladeshense]